MKNWEQTHLLLLSRRAGDSAVHWVLPECDNCVPRAHCTHMWPCCCRIQRCHCSCVYSCSLYPHNRRQTTRRQPVISCCAYSRGQNRIACSLWNDIQRSSPCSVLIRYRPLARGLPWTSAQSCSSTDLMPRSLLWGHHTCSQVLMTALSRVSSLRSTAIPHALGIFLVQQTFTPSRKTPLQSLSYLVCASDVQLIRTISFTRICRFS